MDSTTPSTSSSSTTAAVDPAALRSCPKCRRRMSGLQFDLHTICEPCQGIVCSLDTRCPECKPWSEDKMSAYLKHKVSLAGKRRKRQGSASTTSSPAVASNPSVDSHVRLPSVSEDSVIRDTVLSYLSSLSKSCSLGTNLPSFAAPSPVPDSALSIKGVTGGESGPEPHNLAGPTRSSGVGAGVISSSAATLSPSSLLFPLPPLSSSSSSLFVLFLLFGSSSFVFFCFLLLSPFGSSSFSYASSYCSSFFPLRGFSFLFLSSFCLPSFSVFSSHSGCSSSSSSSVPSWFSFLHYFFFWVYFASSLFFDSGSSSFLRVSFFFASRFFFFLSYAASFLPSSSSWVSSSSSSSCLVFVLDLCFSFSLFSFGCFCSSFCCGFVFLFSFCLSFCLFGSAGGFSCA